MLSKVHRLFTGLYCAIALTLATLTEINDISEGILSDFLRATLETNLPKAGKKKTITLGLSEKNLAGSVKAAFPNLSCETSETSEVVADLLRGEWP